MRLRRIASASGFKGSPISAKYALPRSARAHPPTDPQPFVTLAAPMVCVAMFCAARLTDSMRAHSIQFGSRLSGGQIEEVALQFVAQVDLHVCMKGVIKFLSGPGPRSVSTNRSPRGRSNVSTSNSSVIWWPCMIRVRCTRVPTRTRPQVSSSIAVTEPMICGQFIISATILKTAGGLAATVL